MSGNVILSHNYDTALKQSDVRAFSVLTALHNYVVFGADATNSFVEVIPPMVPIFVAIDK